MAKKEIKISCRGADTANLDELHVFQGDLKELSSVNEEKLWNEILSLDFSDPFSVWIDPDGVKQILDGTQRLRVLKKKAEEGWKIPPLPINLVEANDLRQAKLKVLALTSQYGTMTVQGLDEFMRAAELDFADMYDRFEFGEDLMTAMKRFNDEQRDPSKSPWAWKKQIPVEHKLSTKEMAIPFHDWLKSFRKLYCLFSGGKDSLALIAYLLDIGIKKSKIHLLFCRTPLDHPGTEEYVEKFAKKVKVGFSIVGKQYDEKGFAAMFEKSGFPTPYFPWCTSSWKVSQVKGFMRDNNLPKDKTVCVCIGWRREESERREAAHERCIGQYGMKQARPILDMKKAEVFKLIKDHGWDLHYAYDYTDRLGCYFCYAYKRSQWVNMMKKRPDLFLKALEVVALGSASPNISDQMVRDRLRSMFGLDTANLARRRMGLPIKIEPHSSKWGEPVHDPGEAPEMPEDVEREDFGASKLLTNE